jgi:peptidoglycan/xylan/chitin deacetylase (PgdA/CDA1 family)
MKIILKADDFINNNLFFLYELIEKYNFKVSIGIIGKKLEIISPETKNRILTLIKKKQIELYNHSYWHYYEAREGIVWTEYVHTDLDYQTYSLQKTQVIVKKVFGITMTVFGAPYNSNDSTLIDASKKTPEITHIYYVFPSQIELWQKSQPNRTFIPINGLNLLEFRKPQENNSQYINYDYFKQNFVSQPLITYQLHPNAWSFFDWKEFERIIQFFIEQKIEFIFPTEL